MYLAEIAWQQNELILSVGAAFLALIVTSAVRDYLRHRKERP